ncbi:hypothetical protein ALO52_200072 [Pseudomonas syringae pv. primulae]|uniref:Uncharacterized protein n=1 Tax=Pseudomonas syringae pv. primulae TaxID=251707 RepID=A0A0P9YF58_9PSED|nr:hypothetical protein ALO52_200072 [Pseudomonas syringae pv. primulae]
MLVARNTRLKGYNWCPLNLSEHHVLAFRSWVDDLAGRIHRIVHKSHIIELKGESMRRIKIRKRS